MHGFVLVVMLCSLLPGAGHTVRDVDIKASHATFSVQHVLIERVTGNVRIVSAQVALAADGTTPLAVTATLDATHIDTGDEDRDGDLTGSDWFDTKRFPVWTFTSNRVIAATGGSYAVDGILTIHGVGVPITLATSLVRGGVHPAYAATASVDRHAFGMKVTRVDALVGNTVSIVLDTQLK